MYCSHFSLLWILYLLLNFTVFGDASRSIGLRLRHENQIRKSSTDNFPKHFELRTLPQWRQGHIALPAVAAGQIHREQRPHEHTFVRNGWGVIDWLPIWIGGGFIASALWLLGSIYRVAVAQTTGSVPLSPTPWACAAIAEPDYSSSVGKVFSMVFAPLWLFLAPIALVGWVLLLPYQLVNYLFTGPSVTSPLAVTSYPAASQAAPKGSIFFIHGWPDSGQMWHSQVAYFTQQGYACHAVTLPNHGGDGGGGWGMDFDDLLSQLELEALKHTVNGKVVLFCHDWGSVLGLLLARRRPEIFSHLVLLDVGPSFPETPSFKLFAASYQFFNVFTFLLGHPSGTWAMRQFLRRIGYQARPLTEVSASMNYLYFYYWKRVFTGGEPILPIPQPDVPTYFIYGVQKFEMFHTEEWLHQLKANSQNRVLACESDHWVTITCSPLINAEVDTWLQS